MGVARIINHIGQAQYTVELDYGEDRKAEIVASLSEKIQQAEQEEQERQNAVDVQAQYVADIASALNQLIAEYVDVLKNGSDGDSLRAEVDRVSGVLLEESLVRSSLENELSLAIARKSSIEKRLAEVTSIQTLETRAMWCGDYTTNLSGQVATCELVGEQGDVVVYPPARREGVVSEQIDGFLLARGLMSPEQAFFNAAILPGWQKRKPRHRAGTITAINTGDHTASVTLDVIQSSALSLDIRPDPATLTNAPIRYMDCDSLAFEVGDRVVVEYSQSAPEAIPSIIGFAANPRECLLNGFLVTGPSGVVYIRRSGGEWDSIPLAESVIAGSYWNSYDADQNITLQIGMNAVKNKRDVIASMADVRQAALYGDELYMITETNITGTLQNVVRLHIRNLTTGVTTQIGGSISPNYPYLSTNRKRNQGASLFFRLPPSRPTGPIEYRCADFAVAETGNLTGGGYSQVGLGGLKLGVFTLDFQSGPQFEEVRPDNVQQSGEPRIPLQYGRTVSVPYMECGAANGGLFEWRSNNAASSISTSISGAKTSHVLWESPSHTIMMHTQIVGGGAGSQIFISIPYFGLDTDLTYSYYLNDPDFSNVSCAQLQTGTYTLTRARASRSIVLFFDPDYPEIAFVRSEIYSIYLSQDIDFDHMNLADAAPHNSYHHAASDSSPKSHPNVNVRSVAYFVLQDGVLSLIEKIPNVVTNTTATTTSMMQGSMLSAQAASQPEPYVTTASFDGFLDTFGASGIDSTFVGNHGLHNGAVKLMPTTIAKNVGGDVCISFTFPDTDITFNYLTEGNLETMVGARDDYRPLNVV